MGHRMVDCRREAITVKGLLIDKEKSEDVELVSTKQGRNDKKNGRKIMCRKMMDFY